MSHLVFESDMPKICVPIVGQTEMDIVKAGEELKNSIVDLIEWRGDFFSGITDGEQLKKILLQLRKVLGNKPLLFTLRTAFEGGEISLSFDEYADILKSAAKTGCIDYIDVEIFWGYREKNRNSDYYDLDKINFPKEIAEDSCHSPVRNLLQELQPKVEVIGSYHDFAKTPSVEEITSRLCVMKHLGASIPKIAVMPQTKKDVLNLMAATLQAKEALPDTPMISMSMGALGAVSRVAGANFGSAVTFGCYGKASAPGQIPIEQLHSILENLTIG